MEWLLTLSEKSYKLHTFKQYGIFGKYNQIKVMNCISENIRHEW